MGHDKQSGNAEELIELSSLVEISETGAFFFQMKQCRCLYQKQRDFL